MMPESADTDSSMISEDSHFPTASKDSGGRAGGEGSSNSESTGGLVYGHVSMIGRRREMEDAVAVGRINGKEEYSYFGVCDGLGGAEVPEACSKRLRRCLEKQVEIYRKEKGIQIDWEEVMVETFRSMYGAIEEQMEGGSTATAAVVLVSTEEVVAANRGNSRAVLCRGGVAVPLSRDHQPDSRASRMISSEAEVTLIKRTEPDEFLIIATDGLWAVVCDGLACQTVHKCLNGRPRRSPPSEENRAEEAAATLAEIAIGKGSRDNISIIVVLLK